ncbi:MAG: NTP transferase domain-containing protein [Bacteroidales bacterium]|nr:NTP transferase domain-containing protein [Bacteroidales bacterium]
MNYAIIAAGEGSRLVQEGVKTPKPLVHIEDKPLIGRLLDIFARHGAGVISVIVNDQMTEVVQFVSAWMESHPDITTKLLVQSTPSSMHSMAALCDIMPDGPMVCTTVDTVFAETDFAQYVDRFEQGGGAFHFGVTRYVDDEKPLWVDTDDEGRITAFRDMGPAPFVSGGIYGMDRLTAVGVLHQCLAEGKSRMRNFQRALLQSGVRIKAHEFGKVMDIDHQSDIVKAEKWLHELDQYKGSVRV